VANRRFPHPSDIDQNTENPNETDSPLAASPFEYAERRAKLEAFNLRIWKEAGVSFSELPYITPTADAVNDHRIPEKVVNALANALVEQEVF